MPRRKWFCLLGSNQAPAAFERARLINSQLLYPSGRLRSRKYRAAASESQALPLFILLLSFLTHARTLRGLVAIALLVHLQIHQFGE